MNRHRDFDAARAERQGDPLTFRLAGRDFTIERVPAGPMLDVAAAMARGGLEIVGAFGAFLYDTVPEDQHEALKAALREVDLPDAIDVATWLIEQSVARPLGSAGNSADGPSSNGAASKLAEASIGWTSSQ